MMALESMKTGSNRSHAAQDRHRHDRNHRSARAELANLFVVIHRSKASDSDRFGRIALRVERLAVLVAESA